MAKRAVIQGSLFEQDYLIRTLGRLATVPDVALTELVANAWDAGATRVEITIPDSIGEELVVADDGTGMTVSQFRNRWMTLGYDRISRQGALAEFPPERRDWRRRAYGRYGLGRHGMLCFTNTYTVETWREGSGGRFVVGASSGRQPFALLSEEVFRRDGHGTRLVGSAERNIPQISRIREMLGGRFLHDPRFAVIVNAQTIQLERHEGLIKQATLEPAAGITLRIFVVDSSKTARLVRHHGIAFWVGGRLVGEPSWLLADRALADGRTTVAKRHTIVVRTDDLYDHVLPDWSGFQRTDLAGLVQNTVADYVDDVLHEMMADRVADTKFAVIQQHRGDLEKLRPLARREVADFIESVTDSQPSIQPDLLAAAVEAVINLEKSRSGVALLQKISRLAEDDIEGLNRFLEEWTVRDAMTVLDEIDRRIAVIEALERLSGDSTVDELRTLHPLVTQARWLFGPEYDSPLFASNMTLRRAAEKVFSQRVDPAVFEHPQSRPDLLILKDATVSVVGSETLDDVNGLYALQHVLVIELKRGGSTIGREHLAQATNYVEDILGSGLLDGPPYVRAFVVGDDIDPKAERVRRIGDRPEVGRIDACTFGQLVRTARGRLFHLRDELAIRYGTMDEPELLRRAYGGVKQLELEAEPVAKL